MSPADEKFNIAVITVPSALNTEPRHGLFANFLKIVEPLSSRIYVVTGSSSRRIVSPEAVYATKPEPESKKDPAKYPMLIRVFRRIAQETGIALGLVKVARRNVDGVIFFMATTLVFPMLAARLLRKKTIMVITSSATRYSQQVPMKGIGIIPRLMSLFERINYALSDYLVTPSSELVSLLGLHKYENKIRHGPMYVDAELYKPERAYQERKGLIGYIGRFSIEKGVVNFAEALPLILDKRQDIGILMAGDGPLSQDIERRIGNHLSSRVSLVRWVPHEEVRNYLNELKLLVIPSYTEAGPLIMFESMACGTPVVAAPVGCVPELVKDGETGFIMEDNLPESIARNVLRALDCPNLDEISRKARALIEREYTYQAAVEEYRKVLEVLNRNKARNR